MMKHLWSCLSGLSSQFSATRRGYEWLICMWTGAFTSILIESVDAWPDFLVQRRGAVKNWKRRQICYPYVALRRPVKPHPFMYNTETFKIIASFLSIRSLFSSLSHAHKHSQHLWRKGLVIITCNFLLHWQVLSRVTESRKVWQTDLSLLLNQWHLSTMTEWIRQIATSGLWWKSVCEVAKTKWDVRVSEERYCAVGNVKLWHVGTWGAILVGMHSVICIVSSSSLLLFGLKLVKLVGY